MLFESYFHSPHEPGLASDAGVVIKMMCWNCFKTIITLLFFVRELLGPFVKGSFPREAICSKIYTLIAFFFTDILSASL